MDLCTHAEQRFDHVGFARLNGYVQSRVIILELKKNSQTWFEVVWVVRRKLKNNWINTRLSVVLNKLSDIHVMEDICLKVPSKIVA